MIIVEDFATLIKVAAMQTMEASKPVAVIEGEVIENNPLTIKVSEKLQLKKPNIVLSKGLDLEKGDKVLTLRASGGQKYYVICEVEK